MADDTLITLTADIVAAHVANNHITASAVPELIATVHGALSGLGEPAPAAPVVLTPAVSIRSSVKPDYIVCLEDGAKLTMLKRYLKTKFDMTPEQYRTKWGLPRDYPMVAPNYAEKRRTLAKAIGLGRKPKVISPDGETTPIAKPAKASRKAVTNVESAIEKAATPVGEAVKAGRKKLGIVAAKAAAAAHLGTASQPQPAPRARLKPKATTEA